MLALPAVLVMVLGIGIGAVLCRLLEPMPETAQIGAPRFVDIWRPLNYMSCRDIARRRNGNDTVC